MKSPYGKQRIVLLLLVAASSSLLCWALVAQSPAQAMGEAVSTKQDSKIQRQEPYPHLNSTADGSPARCGLKPEEAEWLEARMEEGKIRLATPEDIKAWEDLAKQKNRPEQKVVLGCGRTFVILKPMDVPRNLNNDVRMSGDIVFFVGVGVPFPNARRAGVAFYDLETGGWYMLGKYDDGEAQGIGSYPRYDPSFYSKK